MNMNMKENSLYDDDLYDYRLSPPQKKKKKKIIGLSASITFEIVN